MRETFLDVLVGARPRHPGVDRRHGARGRRRGRDRGHRGRPRRSYADALIDLLFARALGDEEIENYVNLVRKRDKCQELARVVGSDHSSAREIRQSLKEFCDIPKGELFISPEEAEGIRVSLLSYWVSSQLPFVGIAKRWVTIRDIDAILDHTLGHLAYPGRLGGKAAGMIVAQKILLPLLEHRDPDFERHIAVPDTWYLSSGIFSDFIDRNGFYFFHTLQVPGAGRDRRASTRASADLFVKADFPRRRRWRSSARLIGGGGRAPDHRALVQLPRGQLRPGLLGEVPERVPRQPGRAWRSGWPRSCAGVKTVLASMYGPDPILYRRDHGLLDYNERMAMIVQKVVGRRFGDWFLPFASGVMFSYNSYAWSPKIRKGDGLVRLVFGLGTRAVDRVGGDYPRMIPLSHPGLRPEATPEQVARYSQHMVDAIDLRRGDSAHGGFRHPGGRDRAPRPVRRGLRARRRGACGAPLSRLQELPPDRLVPDLREPDRAHARSCRW